MGKFTISKILALLIFMATFFLIVAWFIGYSTDLAVIFGLRASNVVANDIAGRISSLASVDGEASAEYQFGSSGLGSEGALYDIVIKNYIVCVKSFAAATVTSDCATHPFKVEEVFLRNTLTNSKLLIEKFYIKEKNEYKIRITESTA